MSTLPTAETTTVVVDGVQHAVTRTAGLQDGTVVEALHGIGVIGSERRWMGHRWAKNVRRYAAVNPSGRPGEATAYVEGLMSRHQAWRWLLENAETTR